MLIAIMGDSFANFMEFRNVNGIRTKMQILGEQAPILAQTENKHYDKTFMVVVTPSEIAEVEDDTWQGTVNQLSSVMSKEITGLERKLNKKTDQQEASLKREVATKINSVKAEMINMNSKLDSKIDSVQGDVAQVKQMLETLIKMQTQQSDDGDI